MLKLEPRPLYKRTFPVDFGNISVMDAGGILQPESTRTAAVSSTTEAMIGTFIFLFVVIVLVFFLYLYARRYMRSDAWASGANLPVIPTAGLGLGLDPAVLKSIPVIPYRASDFKEPLECAVCLTELAEGEQARLLPSCHHGFHLPCIDMWFVSHSTCPICRCTVEISAGGGVNTTGGESREEKPVPEVSRKPGGMLAIEIPRVVDGFASTSAVSSPPLPTSRMASAGLRRTLSRLVSRGKRASAGEDSFASPRIVGDIEQGL